MTINKSIGIGGRCTLCTFLSQPLDVAKAKGNLVSIHGCANKIPALQLIANCRLPLEGFKSKRELMYSAKRASTTVAEEEDKSKAG
jgi:hypothetical protein